MHGSATVKKLVPQITDIGDGYSSLNFVSRTFPNLRVSELISHLAQTMYKSYLPPSIYSTRLDGHRGNVARTNCPVKTKEAGAMREFLCHIDA